MSPFLLPEISARSKVCDWLVICILLVSFTLGCSERPRTTAVLQVACAASLQNPVTTLAKQFSEIHGAEVDLQFGGTSMLINQARLGGDFDVLITADQYSTEQILNTGLVSDSYPVALQTPVLAMPEGSHHDIQQLADLLRSEIRIGLGNEGATSIGKATRKALGDFADPLYHKAVVTRASVTALATDLKVGSIDAAIIWDSTARQFDLSFIEDRELSKASEVASACSLADSKNPDLALMFAIYLSKSDEARQVLSECHFAVGTEEFAQPQGLP